MVLEPFSSSTSSKTTHRGVKLGFPTLGLGEQARPWPASGREKESKSSARMTFELRLRIALGL